MPDCGLKVYDVAGNLARELRVQVPDNLDLPTLDLVHRQCMSGLTCSYAVMEQGWRVRALFLHHQLVPPEAVITGIRRRSPGRWLTHTMDLGPGGGGRGTSGPDVFFRQVDLDPTRAWMAALLLRLGPRLAGKVIELEGQSLWSWEVRGERFFYQEHGKDWRLYGAGNTPLLRLEQALHIEAPQTVDEYLWTVGAIPLGKRQP